MTLKPISKAWANPMAQRVYDEIMALPDDAAQLYAAMVVSGGLQYDLDAHHDMIQKRIDEVTEARLATLKEGLLKSYISKRMAGVPVDGLVAAAEAISKADFDPNDYPSWERSRNAEMQARDPSGRFRVMNRKITYKWDKHTAGRQAAQMGIPDQRALRGNKEARKKYQQAYLQVNDLLDQFAGVPEGEGVIHMVYRRPGGPAEQRMTNLGDKLSNRRGAVDAAIFAEGGELTEVSIATPRDLSVRGAAFDLVGALGGSPYVAGRVTAMGNEGEGGTYRGINNLQAFGESWDKYEASDIANPANRVYRRVGAGSRLLGQILGPAAPMKVKMALGAGEYVEAYGPEAQKVIGPHADRAAYRYRGVERKPDPALQGNINRERARLGPDAARNALIYGTTTREGSPGGRVATVEHPSPIVSYFQERLAKPELTHLQRKSGTIPPSEGIIIDRKGNVATQAVGYGDDWYLPFNLKTLSKLKGGEYIRTRTWGGPTTEDIYTGLVAGARAITVISHNGVYTIEFDDSFRGTRRYNDKAARMVKRYGQLLDAVKSTEVTLSDIPHERREEIEREVLREYNPRIASEKAGYRRLLKEKLTDERENPTMAEATKKEVLVEFLNQEADRQIHGVDNPTWNDLGRMVARQRLLDTRDQRARAQALGVDSPDLDEEALYQQYAAQVNTPEALAEALPTDAKERLASHLKHAQDEYRRSMSPLKLDGSGYDKAQRALREQFPYYIVSTRWEQPKPGGLDYGYVKPRFNRPEGAMAGYFDPTIGGIATGDGAITRRNVQPGDPTMTGKISADRTRFQNRFVLREVGDKIRVKPAEGAAGAAAPGMPGAVDTDASSMRKQIAVRALAKKMFGEIQIGGVAGVLDQKTASGKTAREEFKALGMPIYNYADTDAFMEYWVKNSAEAEKILATSAKKAAEGGFIPGLTESEITAVSDPDKLKKGVEWNIKQAFLKPDTTFDFGEEFGPDLTPQAYANRARRVLASLHMEGDPQLTDTDLQEKLTRYIESQQEIYANIDQPFYRDRYDKKEIEDSVKRAVQVKQLMRRFSEAYARVKREAERTAARRQQAGQANPINTLIVGGEGYADEAAQRARQNQNDRIIASAAEPEVPSIEDLLRGDDAT